MSMRARGPGAGWSWLMGGFSVAKREPWKILGATVLFALCVGGIVAIQMYMQLVVKPQGGAMAAMLLAIMLVSGIVYPILMGGFMRVLDAGRNAQPVRVSLLFDPLRSGGGGTRLALFGLCMLLVYVAFLAVLLSTLGHGLLSWYLQLLHQQTLGAPMATLPPLPDGFATALALLTVFFLFYSCTIAIGVGQIALRGQSPLLALRDGVAGAFKNASPLLVLAVCGLVALVVLAVAFGIGIAILLLLGMLVSRILGVVLMILGYIVLVILMYAFMMGVNYAIWHDVADGARGDATQSPLPVAEQ